MTGRAIVSVVTMDARWYFERRTREILFAVATGSWVLSLGSCSFALNIDWAERVSRMKGRSDSVVVVGLWLFERRAMKGREIVFTAVSLFALSMDPVERLMGGGSWGHPQHSGAFG